jgi:hypothetical protein
MPTYRVESFEQELEISDDEEIAGVSLSMAGTSPTRAARNYALVRVPEDEEDTCGYNGCGRTVSDPDELCWQHEDNG